VYFVAWSSGKDSAWTLQMLRQRPDIEVVGLFTTLNAGSDRVAMHDVPRALVEEQAAVAELPLLTAELPWPCSNADYEAAFHVSLDDARERWGITHIAFGDLYLEEIRAYREALLSSHANIASIYPVWSIPTGQLAGEMIRGGLRARVICVDESKLPVSFVGREFDKEFLADLPEGVDPCGENGEFHTFAYDGPMYSRPIHVAVGGTSEKDGFYFADLAPTGIGGLATI
jgi:uncharacterized protein (TIGR00290 family)